MFVAPSGSHERAFASAVAVAALLTSSACGSPTAPDVVSCAALPNPGIPLRSGFVQQTPVDLAPGEACAVRAEVGGALRLAPGDGPATFLIAVQSASRVPAARASLRLTFEGTGATASRSPAPAASRTTGPTDLGTSWSSDAELRFRRSARGELARVRARPARRHAADTRVRRALVAAPPAVGDTLLMRNSVDAELGVDCERPDRVPSVVRAVGQQFAIVEDVEAAGHLTAADYAQIVATLDDPLYRVSEAYFGSPADLDDNQRVLVFVTPIVNRATPRGSSTFIAGFFNPSDLSDSVTCPASNVGEVLYVLAPDPDGQFGDPVEVDFAAVNVTGVSAHEFTHLLSAQQRITIGGGSFADLEESWLDEGLAHTAEMVVGFAAAGLTPGANHGFVDLVADTDIFNTYFLANFRRAGFYLLEPGRTLALGDESGSDPGGAESLRMRGFSWLLLRWIADHAELPAGGILGGPMEESVFRDLTSGGVGRVRGIENVERVAGPAVGSSDWRELIARYGLAPLADDAPGQPTGDSQVTSLHLPDIFAGIHGALPDKDPFRDEYPLQPGEHGLNGSRRSFAFELSASASEYFVVTSTAAYGPVSVTLTTQSGAPITSGVQPQIVIQRTR
ncbi:MAG: hypothetical protein ACC682_05355 [Gemmatimonadota bacterium]